MTAFGLVLATVIALLAHVSTAMAQCVGIAPLSSAKVDAPAHCPSTFVVPDDKGRTFLVGPGKPHETIGSVPWSMLTAGDTVFIHHRAQPYREKILISSRGTAQQWIRVIGVPGPAGELPVISGDGAETSVTMRHRWTDPKIIQHLGLIQVAFGSASSTVPGYIEIANLQVQDAFETYRFKAENGEWTQYSGFSACIYARSVQSLVVRNNVLTNCGLGFYNWTGSGETERWWESLQRNIVLSGNSFYNNGRPNSYLEHQVYTEGEGVTIEYNKFGPMRPGALGSQLKDRSDGTVIRYNSFTNAPSGWVMDLVEPEESWPSLGSKPTYKETFVYGNLITTRGSRNPNMIHWNEDHQLGRGRATIAGSKLHFYHNTLVFHADRSDSAPFTVFNVTWGGYDCPKADLPGIIDVRNNIIAVVPSSPRDRPPPIRLGYCGLERIALSNNWISPGAVHRGTLTGNATTITSLNNDPGFQGAFDFRLRPGASAKAAGGTLSEAVAANARRMDFTPSARFTGMDKLGPRDVIGKASDLGAF